MTINENSVIRLLFPWKIFIIYFILLIPSVFPAELFSPILVLCGVLFLILTGGIIKISYLKNSWPLLLILITGIMGINNNSIRHIIRDILYALTPLSLFYIGYYFSENRLKFDKILKAIIILGFIFSIIHLAQFVITPSLLLEKVDILRQNTFNPGGGLIILSLILGTLQYRLGFDNLFPGFLPRFIVLPLLFLSVVFSFSRIGLVITITLLIAFTGYLTRINWKSILSIVILAFGLIYLILSTPTNETGTFRSKISKTITEITVSDYQDLSDVNQNWRGYETFRALLKFSRDGITEKIVGSGFGSVVDLGLSIKLGDTYLSEIPIFHNGYAYILVKTGLLGLLCYLIFYFNLLKYPYKYKNSVDPEHIILSQLLLGCILSMILSMYVVGGIAEIHDSEFIFLSGFIVRRLEIV